MIQCLILLCGPPACLKSTLIKVLQCLSGPSYINLQCLCVETLINTRTKKNFSCSFILFDDLLRDYEQQIINIEESNWKLYRSLIADHIEQYLFHRSATSSLESNLTHAHAILDRLNRILGSIDDHSSILIIEDNFYYSSMRQRYRQIAQRAHIGFASIHLYSHPSIAYRRNQQRPSFERVSDVSFQTIFDKYELSDDDLSLNTGERGLTTQHITDVLQRIRRACDEPEEDVQSILDNQRCQATKINQENFLYQCDQKLRKFISKYIQEKLQSATDKKSLAQMINEQRQVYLQMIKQGSITVVDIDHIESSFREFIENKN